METPNDSPHKLVDHFFRHEYGRLVSSLSRRFGPHRLELIEDCVQNALSVALTSWALKGLPERPQAWLTQVAKNQIIDHLRREDTAQRALEKNDPKLANDSLQSEPELHSSLKSEFDDAQLQMLFVCCSDAIPQPTQLALALKILCGFSTQEIAIRLLTTEGNIYKRITRGREALRKLQSLETPPPEELEKRIASVHRVIYLIFTEGYCSANPDHLVRRELCDEAMRLASILSAHPLGDRPESWALLALMNFHVARLDARVDGTGGLLLLEEQDRSLWDREKINTGWKLLTRSASGETFSRYHAEAGILFEHCIAPTFEQTRWHEIVSLYEMLNKIEPSPIHVLNQAIALAQWQGAEVGLQMLEELNAPGWLHGYYLWDATLGELRRQTGELEIAKEHLRRALKAAPTDAEKIFYGVGWTVANGPESLRQP